MSDYIMELRKLVCTRPLIFPGANVIILDDEDRILLHHRRDIDIWGLPGGFCEPGETVEQTAAREVKEEVGLTCNKLVLFNVYSGEKQHFKYPHGDEVYNVTSTFICTDFEGTIKVDEKEGRDARFFSFDEMPSNIAAGIKVILEDFKSSGGLQKAREHRKQDIINKCKTQFFLSFSMVEKLIEQCPEDIWSIKAGGFIFWQQILHTLTGTGFWMRKPGDSFTEPFAERKVYPELDNEPVGNVTREEMLEFKEQVKELCIQFFENRDDTWILSKSHIYDKISNMDVVIGQIRHMQYHVGHCDSILRERGLKAVEWVDYFGE